MDLKTVDPTSPENSRAYVVVTRPRAQLVPLMGKLQAEIIASGLSVQAVGLPLLEIQEVMSPNLAQDLLTALVEADLVVFVSPNAVMMSNQLLKNHQMSWPKNLLLGVTGGGSEKAIHEADIFPKRVIKPVAPDQWDSEGLWEVLTEYQQSWMGKKVVFIRGEGGRHWLAGKMRSAGAHVESFAVYRRVVLPVSDPAWMDLKALIFNERNPKQQGLWLLTSSEAVRYIPEAILALGFSPDVLKDATAICSHERITRTAVEIGFGEVLTCAAGDELLVKSTMEWLNQFKIKK